MTILDDTKKKEISALYNANLDVYWYDIDSKYARSGDGMRCYGIFENCIVLFKSTQLDFIETKKVADSEFTHTSSFALYAYYDNCLYSLEEAYDKGLISSDDVETAAERHRIVEDYIKSLRYVANTKGEETTGKPIETTPPSGTADTTGKQNSKPKDTTDKIVTTTPPAITNIKPEKPSDDLLKRIEVDYVSKVLKECGNGPYTYYNHASVYKYYGTYNGAVPVIITCAGITHSAAEREETVGGYVFRYSSGNGIQVWKNGSFFSLRDAYYQGFITKENLAQISVTEPIVYSSPRDDYSFSDVKGFDIPEVKLLEQIENDYYDYRCSKNDNANFAYIIAYYGKYNGCVPVKFRRPIRGAYMPREVVIADIVFKYGDPIDIIIWKNGDFYTLEEAYAQGILTKKEIAAIAEINNSGEYLSFSRY